MNAWLTKYRVPILGAIFLLVAVLLVLLIVRLEPATTITIVPAPPTATPGPIEVYVSGEVQTDGLYILPSGARVQDALDAAGGPTADAELERTNLARILTDGEHVYIPAEDEVVVLPGTEDQGPVVTGPLNINIATPAELETLPGIGPSLAAAIIEYRETNGPFQAIEDIQQVSGIGPATFENLRDLITVN